MATAMLQPAARSQRFLVEDGVAWHSDDEGQPTPATQEADALTILQEAWQANPQWRTMIFPFAVAVPGMLHIVDNLLLEADTLMTAWEEWWGQLKNINALLSNQLRLNKFCARCLLQASRRSRAL